MPTITTRAGKFWISTVTRVLWTSNDQPGRRVRCTECDGWADAC